MKKHTDNVFEEKSTITRDQRNLSYNHNSFTIWFTGLSGSGKSTLAKALEKVLFERNVKTYILDGDNIRLGINNDLGFTNDDRKENLRRIAHIANLMNEAGLVVIASFISPFQSERNSVREILGNDNYFEIYVNTPLEICEKRDAKGLYKKARAGEIINFTGIDSPYEPSLSPDLKIDTSEEDIPDSVEKILKRIEHKLKR